MGFVRASFRDGTQINALLGQQPLQIGHTAIITDILQRRVWMSGRFRLFFFLTTTFASPDCFEPIRGLILVERAFGGRRSRFHPIGLMSISRGFYVIV